MNYRDFNDNELLSYICENNEEANTILFKKYEPLINSIARKMYKYCKNTGLELNDLIQEGMLGLNLAINHYDEQKDATFYTFAKKCIERKMLSMIIGAKRLKHKILNESLSLEGNINDSDSIGLEAFISDSKNDPELVIINNEEEAELINRIKKRLTDFECQVFELKICNFNYKEIAEILDKSPKAIDNALQRIKAKAKEELVLNR
ncbi:MAG: sigma-70 family RNA polymerase sigma factor [Mollicutes bacterium]|nr:sigma-70 family RNA polymerase sigma factor [Mollicutes bacterium]